MQRIMLKYLCPAKQKAPLYPNISDLFIKIEYSFVYIYIYLIFCHSVSKIIFFILSWIPLALISFGSLTPLGAAGHQRDSRKRRTGTSDK